MSPRPAGPSEVRERAVQRGVGFGVVGVPSRVAAAAVLVAAPAGPSPVVFRLARPVVAIVIAVVVGGRRAAVADRHDLAAVVDAQTTANPTVMSAPDGGRTDQQGRLARRHVRASG